MGRRDFNKIIENLLERNLGIQLHALSKWTVKKGNHCRLMYHCAHRIESGDTVTLKIRISQNLAMSASNHLAAPQLC